MPMYGADRKGWVEIAYSQSSRWQAEGEAGMPASSVSCPFRDMVSGVDSQGSAAKGISDPEEKKEISKHPRNTSGPRPFSDKLLRGISVLVVTVSMLPFATDWTLFLISLLKSDVDKSPWDQALFKNFKNFDTISDL